MKRNFDNPFIIFLPLLLLYFVFIFLMHDDANVQDEGKYLMYAQNLLQGFYSPPDPNIYLGVGPGYPIFLTIFLLFNIPLLFISLFNGLFYYLTVVIVFKLLSGICDFWKSILISVFVGMHFNIIENLPFILPETLPPFLLILIVYILKKAFNASDKRKKILFLVFSGGLLGFLALTKIIFGYVIVTLFIVYLFFWILKIDKTRAKSVLFVLIVGFIVTLPYLFYTYNLTGRIFYWGSVGGNNLYWMSTLYEDEYGSWYPFHATEIDSVSLSVNPIAEKMMKERHSADHTYFFSLNGAEQDDAYKEKAMHNITTNPLKFLKNCISNTGRILFSFPFSHTLQKPSTLMRLPFNGVIVVFFFIILFPLLYNWKKIDFSVRFGLITAFIYFGGSILGSAETRMFNAIVPILVVTIGLVLHKSVIFKLKFD